MTTRLIIVGGFLGSGKTSLLLQAAQTLSEQGYRVGLISNDQGEGLVDTEMAKQQQLPITEVAGGCFCCKFPDLVKAFQALQTQVQPDIILAEPVGSCTDLIATVLNPLSRYYAGEVSLAPLSILVDGTRDLASFPDQVRYLFEKQVAEAQVIVLNKTDLMAAAQQQQELTALSSQQPQTRVFSLSARTGAGVVEWLNFLLGQDVYQEQAGLEIDYARYAEAEAALGWLNAKGLLHASEGFPAKAWLETFLSATTDYLQAQGADIAHLKVHATTARGDVKASVTSSAISWDVHHTACVEQLSFTINARVNTLPSLLEQAVVQGLERSKPSPGSRFYFTHFECFQPAPPTPSYRLHPAPAEER